MLVSIIIVNYNTFQLTVNCIKSIYEKTLNVSFEIILVDNNSTECNPQLFKVEFPNSTVIENLTNVGFAAGNNIGISHAKGDIILLLNSDAELVNNAIFIALEILEADGKIGALTGKLIYPDGRIQNAVGSFPSIRNECFELFRLGIFERSVDKATRLKGDLWDYTKATSCDWIWGTFFMFRKNILSTFPNNKFHEDFFMYYEDVLWCYHIKKYAKLGIQYSPEPIIMHHMSASSVNANLEEIYLSKIVPNEYAFLVKTKGRLYAFLYYIIKSVHQFTLRKKNNIHRSVFYLKFLKSKIFLK